MTYHGTFKNGVILLDRPVDLPEGQRVIVEPEPIPIVPAPNGSAEPSDQSKELLKIAGICNSGRSDGSVNHDHYIYGKPKREASS